MIWSDGNCAPAGVSTATLMSVMVTHCGDADAAALHMYWELCELAQADGMFWGRFDYSYHGRRRLPC
jgi:hypothetical protein